MEIGPQSSAAERLVVVLLLLCVCRGLPGVGTLRGSALYIAAQQSCIFSKTELAFLNASLHSRPDRRAKLQEAMGELKLLLDGEDDHAALSDRATRAERQQQMLQQALAAHQDQQHRRRREAQGVRGRQR